MYGIRFEAGPDGIGAFFPDIPGIGVVGDDMAHALSLLEEALQWHVEALVEDGQPLPEPTNDIAEYRFFLSPRMHAIVVDDAFAKYVYSAMRGSFVSTERPVSHFAGVLQLA